MDLHIQEEVSSQYPPKIGTEYKNRGNSEKWNSYKVVEFKKNKLFTLQSADKTTMLGIVIEF